MDDKRNTCSTVTVKLLYELKPAVYLELTGLFANVARPSGCRAVVTDGRWCGADARQGFADRRCQNAGWERGYQKLRVEVMKEVVKVVGR